MNALRLAGLAFALALATGTAAGQGKHEPDSVTVAWHHTRLVETRRALTEVSARINDFRRDLQGVGAQTVVARRAQLVEACMLARGVVLEHRTALRQGSAAQWRIAERDTMIVALGTVISSLDRECLRGLHWPSGEVDSLQAWGPYRTSRLSQAITRYHSAAARFARQLGIDLSR